MAHYRACLGVTLGYAPSWGMAPLLSFVKVNVMTIHDDIDDGNNGSKNPHNQRKDEEDDEQHCSFLLRGRGFRPCHVHGNLPTPTAIRDADFGTLDVGIRQVASLNDA